MAGCAVLLEVLVELAEVEGGLGGLDSSVVTCPPITLSVITALGPSPATVKLRSGEQLSRRGRK